MDSPELLPALLHGRAYLNYKIDRWLGRKEMMAVYDDYLNDMIAYGEEHGWDFEVIVESNRR